MIRLDRALLEELGLGALEGAVAKAFLEHIYETLEMRVGTELASAMSDEQLSEFEVFIDSGAEEDESAALAWLEDNLPSYRVVVGGVFEALKEEIRGLAPAILASMGEE